MFKIKEQITNYLKNNDSRITLIASFVYNLIGLNKLKIRGENKFRYSGSFFKRCSILVRGKGNYINIGTRNAFKNGYIYICGNNNKITINKRNYFNNVTLWIEDDNNEIYIGEHNTIEGSAHIAVIEGTKVEIGNNCLFSTDVTFRTGDSHSIISVQSGKRINPSKSIKIGNHIWFGHKSTILKGVVILDNSIVATSAVVTKPFLDSGGIILGGNPAKIIKEDINWNRTRI